MDTPADFITSPISTSERAATSDLSLASSGVSDAALSTFLKLSSSIFCPEWYKRRAAYIYSRFHHLLSE